ncbi:phosphatase [Haloprofundus marisrubri]|uniref:5'-nucleotidase SurE n=1 Tax=Haloprofundus marisrubri TaxID=1514971 RepID=A0A0W1R933_9EURY|nr:5'/3'-nucleotidase SurE [Haloprofundus marisrubri]KTG09696.1 phosphatase [Haloprofundus marisrubri]
MQTPRVLLTNDDGIDAPGIEALYRELDAVADVTVIAPDENQSGMGRTRNGAVTLRDHEWGYRLAGTPADCVAFGLGGGLDTEFDIVVSGINDSPNLGNYVVGRSGTVGAGIEASFLGTPAIAVSAYHSEDFHCHPGEEYEFVRPAVVARDLLEQVWETEVFDDVDLLNVNAPVDIDAPPLRLTHVLADYAQSVEEAEPAAADGGEPSDTVDAAESETTDREVRLVDQTWPHVVGFGNPMPGIDEHRERYPEDSDRRAVVDGAVSVSPLSMTHDYVETPELDAVVESVASSLAE